MLWGQDLLAQFDVSVGLGGRTYPKSGSLEATAGYSYVFWGDYKESGDLNPWYGYVRPYVKPGLSTNYNSLEAGVELFPVSFLGVRAFNKQASNTGNIEAFDCQVIDCQYDTDNTTTEVDLVLGYKSVFLGARLGNQKFEESEVPNQTTPIIDVRSALTWIPNEDDELDYTFCFLGYRISEEWQTIALYNKYEIERTGDESESAYLFVNKNWGKLSTGIGVGTFESEVKEEKTSVIFSLKWTLLKGPSLF